MEATSLGERLRVAARTWEHMRAAVWFEVPSTADMLPFVCAVAIEFDSEDYVLLGCVRWRQGILAHTYCLGADRAGWNA